MPLLSPTDFELVSGYCRSSHKCGGVAIFRRKESGLHTNALKFIQNLSVELHIEICATEVAHVLNNCRCAVLCIYRPPKGDLNIFTTVLEKAIASLTSRYRYVVCAGDLNINYLNRNSFQRNVLLDIFSSFSLNLTLDTPTRILKMQTAQLLLPQSIIW